MDNRTEVQAFLASRRAKVKPEQAGLTSYGHRRVPGLRREEVATLAGVSAEYYARMERGNLHGASDSVLDAVARALQLDTAERSHLFNLAHAAAAPTSARSRRAAPQRVRAAVQQLLDSMTWSAALIRNGRLDYLAANQLGRALFAPMFEPPASGNSARFVFLDQRSGDFYPDWDKAAREVVALLRAEAGRNPYDKGLTALVGELSTRSADFGQLWASHDVRLHRAGSKTINHPVVGELVLSYEAMTLTADDGLTLNAFTASPHSAAADDLRLLASWAADAFGHDEGSTASGAVEGAEQRPS